jgi:oxygen-independent coproporphyrinogen-3 oxidase
VSWNDTSDGGRSVATPSPERIRGARRSSREDSIRHVYVHIPFCARICPYCAFYKDLLDRSETNRFCQALLQEARQQAKGRPVVPSTIYFGGGTPTALTTAQLELVLGGFRDIFDLSELVEWTTEANPGSVSARKAEVLGRLGITRISLGVQSWDDDLLRTLGREHDARQAERSFRVLRDAGFVNINIDLMFGLPAQTKEQWRETLERTIDLGPDHISAYGLTFEQDTEFFLRHSRGELRSNVELEADLFEMAMSILPAAGYEHYEISNYARPGFASAHNLAYWSGADYVGLGPSAFSTAGMQRWQNVCDYRAYGDRVFAGKSLVDSVEELTPEMKRTERIALGLRTGEGVPTDLLQDRQSAIREFVELGLMVERNRRFMLTAAGKSLADSVAGAFV